MINGGFFCFVAAIIAQYINDGDATTWEREPLSSLAQDGQLMAYQHDGFFGCDGHPAR